MDMRVQPDAAAQTLLALARPTAAESLPLMAALGRVCFEDMAASIPNPPFARSAYDGFALRAADSQGASGQGPAVLRIVGELPAGTAPMEPLSPGCAVKILTGAPLPPEADAVVAKERVQAEGEALRVFEPLLSGANIAPMGEDIRRGEIIARQGDRLSAAALGLIASQGLGELRVYRRPRVALINTGSELVSAGEPCGAAKIYNTNLYTIGAALEALGAVLSDAGIVPDDTEAIAAAIAGLLPTHDAVFLTGGASVGDYDYTLGAMEKLGGRVLFWKTAMKPGGAMLAAEIGGKTVVGLSGNPGAAMMGLLRVAAPFVKGLCGRRDSAWPRVRVLLKEPLKKPSPQMRLVSGRLGIEEGQACFYQNARQFNGAISSFSDCELIAEIPAGSEALPAGTLVTAYRIIW